MKKVISFAFVITFLFSFAGCSISNESSSSKSTADATETEVMGTTVETEKTTAVEATTSDSKTLVVYFSRAGEQYGVGVIDKGNTAIVADMIIEQTGANSFEILPKEDNYPTAYNDLTDYAKEEQNAGARPEIASWIDNFNGYDTVYLGYPIWWGDLPMICYTFLESYDFSGKTVIPFCTHAGSGNAGTQSKIQSAVPYADVKEVLAISGTDTQNNPESVKSTVTEWLKGIDK